MRSRNLCLVLASCFLFSTLAGCEPFVRKFTRKSKKTDQTVEMVLAPEEYKGPQMTKEELYRQYFLFWQSWEGELESALERGSNLKKKLDCVQEALKNLVNMKGMLVPGMQKNLDIYLERTIELMGAIKSDIYGMDNNTNLKEAERIKMDIHRSFAYPKIKDYLK